MNYYDCQKEVREKKFSPRQFMSAAGPSQQTNVPSETEDIFSPKLIYMVNKSQSYGQFNFSIMPSHAKPRLICECCQSCDELPEKRLTGLVFGHDTDKLCDLC